VTVMSSPCTNVTITDLALRCTAPPGSGIGAVVVTVDRGSGTIGFAYPAPHVVKVSVTVADADGTDRIVVYGNNLALRASSVDVSVRTGPLECTSVTVINSSAIECSLSAAAVGRYPVTVSLNGQNSSSSVSIARMCGDDRFGFPAQLCGPCPSVSDGCTHDGWCLWALLTLF
jgi:hypothetical protein